MQMRVLVVVSALVALSCRTSGETAITREVKDAGGGDPAVVSPGALRVWFIEHPNFATHIAGECRAAVKPGGWADSTEGKVCGAAIETERQKAGRDHKAF